MRIRQLEWEAQHLASSEWTQRFWGTQSQKGGKTKQPIRIVAILDLFSIVYYLELDLRSSNLLHCRTAVGIWSAVTRCCTVHYTAMILISYSHDAWVRASGWEHLDWSIAIEVFDVCKQLPVSLFFASCRVQIQHTLFHHWLSCSSLSTIIIFTIEGGAIHYRGSCWVSVYIC